MKSFLDEKGTERILKKCGFEALKWNIIKNYEDALDTSWKLGYPVIIKLVHEDGSRNLRITDTPEEIRSILPQKGSSYQTDGNSPGIYLQNKPAGKEVSIGFLRNEGYAPAVSLSLGGIFSSILKEISYASTPFKPDVVFKMMEDIGATDFLNQSESTQIIESMMKISEIGMEKKEIIEMDIKLVVHEKGALVLDASVIVG